MESGEWRVLLKLAIFKVAPKVEQGHRPEARRPRRGWKVPRCVVGLERLPTRWPRDVLSTSGCVRILTTYPLASFISPVPKLEEWKSGKRCWM